MSKLESIRLSLYGSVFLGHNINGKVIRNISDWTFFCKTRGDSLVVLQGVLKNHFKIDDTHGVEITIRQIKKGEKN